ncbi:uncharacterized protein K452DRAFT_296488 [Aplosporella prunicola CBS 121167]|uniref:Uncharacterized protein n=1 Tax=Aplosporella prunicola CBS 121167 TaxID=1176127 RepID=A0A6A6BJT5_9PEZI|nr:uncharacterized protein K452DRAFT_296488 [Aplosporella prunicola CBS 121167]KAF2144286.1 hypothetical protein K452DRAFT_296488 [Aplosporella prunicola CBS 121167]
MAGLPSPRPFSTAARVHPTFQAHLNPTFTPHHAAPSAASIAHMHATLRPAARKMPKWFMPVTAALAFGVAATSYLDRRYSPTRSAAGLSQAEARSLAQNERNAALMAAYGSRDSLEDMQKAIELYEVQ